MDQDSGISGSGFARCGVRLWVYHSDFSSAPARVREYDLLREAGPNARSRALEAAELCNDRALSDLSGTLRDKECYTAHGKAYSGGVVVWRAPCQMSGDVEVWTAKELPSAVFGVPDAEYPFDLFRCLFGCF